MGQYVNRVNNGATALATELGSLMQHTFNPVAARQPVSPTPDPPLGPDDRKALDILGKKITVETIVSRQGDYPDPNRRIRPHESLIAFVAPGGGDPSTLAETNPVIYALLLDARARLLQMESGLNYLGYSDSYVPPWRFSFLLDRARYFAEHAKTAQREYLNFLGNAEREEFQELTAAQNVEMEKSNIRIETARVDQVTLEVESAKASTELAQLTASNAMTRLDEYTEFDSEADDLADQVLAGAAISAAGSAASSAMSGAATGAAIGAAGGPIGMLGGAILGGALGFMSGGGGLMSERAQLALANEQREYEKISLGLTAREADQAALVGLRQLAVAESGLVVAGMQRAAAVLRHEFALQNLTWLRNRTLNAELWYRLASSVRGVADTYLRYGIEMAFLAEQAYEFEADKRVDVIRFDYDVSDLGDMLAGDFLLRDLDTLEQDLIVTQRIRQQRVRYVLSMARECPEALSELRANGAATFGLAVEQIERRFPGLFNVRVGSVEVLPVALMDPTRFNLELTQLGSGQVRLKAGGEGPDDVLGADWLTGLEAQWAIRPRTIGPETALYSGVSRPEASESSFFTSMQRGAFEGAPGASAWRVDLSMHENRIVPNSLADLLITFTFTGYFDATLRDAIDHSPRRPLAVTSWLSAHQWFPDAFYEFNRSGVLEWQVTPELLTIHGGVDALRNIGVVCLGAQDRPELGRLMCSYPVEFELDASGNVTLLRQLPPASLTVTGLDVDATLNLPPGATVTFDFGDGSGPVDSTELPHSYARPGRYDVRIRVAGQQRLTEYVATIVVSRQHEVLPPLLARPSLEATVVSEGVRIEPSLDVAGGETVAVTWRIDGMRPVAGVTPPSFVLQPGRHVLHFTAIRPLTARFHSRQRFDPDEPFLLNGLAVATNRTFDTGTGNETTTSMNAFGQHVFSAGPVAPNDVWTLELRLDENPALASVSPADLLQHYIGELADTVLALEYVVRDE
jgi:hypothetical protein